MLEACSPRVFSKRLGCYGLQFAEKGGRVLLKPFIPVALAFGLAFAGACYAPTEVTLALSTDLSCPKAPTPALRTAIYKGNFPELDPDPANGS